MKRIWLNDRLVPENEARVATDDRGFTLGDGLFETMRITGGRVFRLPAHLDRLRRSALRIGLPCPAVLEAAIEETLAANPQREGALRLTLTRGRATPGLKVPAAVSPTLTIVVRPYPRQENPGGSPARAIIASGRLNEHAATAGLKHLGYLEQIVAQREAEAAGVDDAIRLNTAGHLAEAAAANLFVVNDGTLVTPTPQCGALEGVTRGVVLQLARAIGIPARAEPLPLERLQSAGEAFLTSSLREIVPLVEVNGRPIGSGRAGALTLRLLAQYRELVRVETQAAVEPGSGVPGLVPE